MKKLLWIAAIGLWAETAHATVAVELGGPELAVISDVIVHARVVKLGAHVEQNPLRVFTDADLEVIEGIKGASAGDRVHLSYPGGVARGLGMFVSGQVALGADQECVIYLRRQSDNSFIPAAMRQGFFAVQKREYDGVRLGVKNTAGLALLTRTGNVQALNETPKQLVRPLGQVIEDIRADVKASEKIDRHSVVGAR